MWTRWLVVLLAFGAMGACAPRGTGTLHPEAAAFAALTERYLEGDFSASGRGDDPASNLGADADIDARDAAGRLRSALAQIDTSRLSTDERVDWLLLNARAERTLLDTVLRRGERVPNRYVPLGGLYWRVAEAASPDAEDWVWAAAQLEAAPTVLAVGRERLEAPPPLWIRLAVANALGTADFLDVVLLERIAEAPDSTRPRLRTAAAAARDALRSYAAFLTDTLQPGAVGSWAVGSAYYDRVLRESNFLPYTAESMIAEGYRVHEETKVELDALARTIDSTKSWRELVDEMQERHPEPGSIVEAYRRASLRVLGFLISRDLIRIPPCEELLYVPTPPALRETYAWGGYGGIRERDSVLYGRFFATDVVDGMSSDEVQDKLRAQSYGWISVIALHEGYPGHHLQSVYARLNPNRLRRRFSNTYYGEGWALYAEHWMQRAGLFTTPDERLAQLQMRLWRTARVIVDPSLHTGRMSYEDAVQFFVDEVGLTRSAAEAEVNRYTTLPTQAPSYIIGWLEIERLKRDLLDVLGDAFDERQFHEALLEQGSVPPALLARTIREALGVRPTD
jgi:uncharacterized protein (DUF885 family)